MFSLHIKDFDFTDEERRVAIELNRRGYAVIDFPDPDIMERSERIKAALGPRFGLNSDRCDGAVPPGNHRIQDAWTFDEDVKAIASNSAIIGLLSKLYGRRAIPFQTLNFPVGTEQHAHTDTVHFSSLPERFMCGVWLAMEDIHEDAGPLLYYPGSHRWPILSNAMIGRASWNSSRNAAQAPFEQVWNAMVCAEGAVVDRFIARKGQALIWAANLLHGGDFHKDRSRTRWSQVTHYYFEDCIYYTPAYSAEALGKLDLREIYDIATGQKVANSYLGEPLEALQEPSPNRPNWRRFLRFGKAKTTIDAGPDDFDSDLYHELNPDVKEAGEDALNHYLLHGRSEGRTYRRD